MTVKEYLNQHKVLNKMIEINLEELKRIKDLSFNVISIAYDSEYIQTTRSTSAPFEKWVDKKLELEERLSNKVCMLFDLKFQIMDMIDELDNIDERLVIYYRYIDCLEWEDICYKLNVSERTVFRWHGSALVHLKLPEKPINLKFKKLAVNVS